MEKKAITEVILTWGQESIDPHSVITIFLELKFYSQFFWDNDIETLRRDWGLISPIVNIIMRGDYNDTTLADYKTIDLASQKVFFDRFAQKVSEIMNASKTIS